MQGDNDMYGKILRFMRLSKRLKQSEVADIIGVANSTLAHYESECRAVTLETAKQIADACNYEILFKNKDNNRIYRIDDMKQIDYDIRVITK